MILERIAEINVQRLMILLFSRMELNQCGKMIKIDLEEDG